MAEEKDFKKEFEEFARKIKEENNPIFKDSNLEFDDFDNLINIINKDIPLTKNNDELKEELKELFNEDLDISKDLDNLFNKSNNFEDDFNFELDSSFSQELSNYPSINLETDDIKMSLIIKKDYSTIEMENRKKEFIKDLKDFIDEFASKDDLNELMKFYE